MKILTLLLEGEVLCEMSTFVISSEKEQSRRVDEFQCPEIYDALYAKVASVDVVTQEEIFGRRRRTSNLEQLH